MSNITKTNTTVLLGNTSLPVEALRQIAAMSPDWVLDFLRDRSIFDVDRIETALKYASKCAARELDTEKMTDMLVQRNLQRSKEAKFNAISSFSCATFDMAVKMQKLLNRLAECDKAQTNEEYVLIEEALVYFSEQIQRHFRSTFGHKMVLEVNVEKD